MIEETKPHGYPLLLMQLLTAICGEARKRYVSVGKNAKKVLALLQSFSILFCFSLDM